MKLCDEAILEDHRPASTDAWTSLTATDLTYPSGRQVTSGYDALYRRNSVSETSGGASIAAWQFFGNRTALVELGNGVTCSFMNNAGTRSAVQAGQATPPWGDKTTDQLGYDGSGRLISKRFLPSSSTTALVGFTTYYDPASNKLFERALHAESRSALYPNYDSINRLLEYDRGILASSGGSITTAITLPGTDSQRTYNLDDLGNWKNTAYTPVGGSPTTEIRRHNLVNQITKFATTPVLYDHGNNAASSNPLVAAQGNGNIADDGTRVYGNDALNRLTTVSSTASGTPQVAAYTYDALGRRVLKVTSNGGIAGTIVNATYRYLYDGNQIVEELLVGETTTTLRQFVWGQYIDELIQLNVPATTTTPPLTAGTYYPLQDLLYRTTATTNSSGAIVEAYDYDAYGNTLMYNGPGTDGLWFTDDDVTTLQPMCEFLFTGRQYDPETEIYWYRARYYQQFLGRFVNRDPLLYPNGMNTYAMESNSPIGQTDPSGLYPKGFPGARPTDGDPGPDSRTMAQYERDRTGKHVLSNAGKVLFSQLYGLLTKSAKSCPKCVDEARDLANIIDMAVSRQPWMVGGTTGDIINFCTGAGVQCGDWQLIIQSAIQTVLNKRNDPNPCFKALTVDGYSNPNRNKAYFQHHWVEIQGSTPGVTVVVDPWPSGGSNIVDDSRVSSYSNRLVIPMSPVPTTPATAPTTPATAPATRCGCGPTTGPAST